MKGRRLLCLLFALFLTLPLHTSAAVLHELANCRKIFSYSGGAAAYFYGFYGSRLVSSRVLPDSLTRTTDVPGNILCVCHDDNSAYALYKESLHTNRVVRMNMNSGSCTHTAVAAGRTIQHTSLAAAADEVFVIVVENGVSYVLGTRGGTENAYRFAHNIDRLFVSGNAAYARLDGGAVYRLGGGQSTLAGGTAPADDATAVYANGKTATLLADFTFTVRDANPSAETPSVGADDILTVTAGTTVRQLKTQLGASAVIYDADGGVVDSGALKTGYTVTVGGSRLALAVGGDVNGTGTVNSADVNALMQHFSGSETLSHAAKRAADMNGDGSTDNRDLVLLARAAA